MANQNIITYNLQDNVTPGLKAMQQQGLQTASALQKIGTSLSNLSVATTAISGFVKAQQSLATTIKSNTQLITKQNKELSNVSDAETAIKGLIKTQDSLGASLKANTQLLTTEAGELVKFDKSMQNAGNSSSKTGTEHMGKVIKSQGLMHKGFGQLADSINTKYHSALDQANGITSKANDLYGSSSKLVGDLSGGVTSFSSVINIAKDATNVWKDAQGLFNAVMDANPVGATIAVIQLLVKAISYAWDKSEGFRQVVMGLWETIKPFGKVIFDVLVLPFKLVGDALQSVFYAVKAVWDALTGHFSKAGDDLKQAVYYGFEAPVKDMKETVTGAIKDTKEAIDSAQTNYKQGEQEGHKSFVADHKGAATSPDLNSDLADTRNKLTVPGSDTGKAKNSEAPKIELSEEVNTTPKYTTEPKTTNITANIQNLIKDFTINTGNLKEGVANAKQMVAQALVEAVNDFKIKSGAGI